HLDALVGDVELVGCNLRERGEDALAELALAGEDRHGAVGVDADPAIEHAIGLKTAGQARRLLRDHAGRPETEADDNRAGGLEKLSALHAISFAARCTARTMRLCVPQRQKLADNAFLICASVGFGFLSSKALAVTIMPLVQ